MDARTSTPATSDSAHRVHFDAKQVSRSPGNLRSFDRAEPLPEKGSINRAEPLPEKGSINRGSFESDAARLEPSTDIPNDSSTSTDATPNSLQKHTPVAPIHPLFLNDEPAAAPKVPLHDLLVAMKQAIFYEYPTLRDAFSAIGHGQHVHSISAKDLVEACYELHVNMTLPEAHSIVNLYGGQGGTWANSSPLGAPLDHLTFSQFVSMLGAL